MLGEIAILAGSVMDTLNTVGATYLKNGSKPKITTHKNNDHDEPPYTILHRQPTGLYFSAHTPPPLAIDGMMDSPDIVG